MPPMKKIYLFLILCFPILCHAQTAAEDSLFNVEKVDQFNASRNGNDHLINICNYDVQWMEYMLTYVFEETGFRCGPELTLEGSPCKITLTNDNGRKVLFSIPVTEGGKMRSMKISGDAWAMIKLFLFYWPADAQYNDDSQLKKLAFARKRFNNDEITFYWNSGNPYINVRHADPGTVKVGFQAKR